MKKNNLTINLQIITPERTLCQEEVFQVTLPVIGGEITITPNHLSYIGALKTGEIIYKKDKNDKHGESLFVMGGFVEFNNNQLIILADEAEMAYEIDLSKAEEARKRAEEIKSKAIRGSDIGYASVATTLERELARTKVARKYLTRRGI